MTSTSTPERRWLRSAALLFGSVFRAADVFVCGGSVARPRVASPWFCARSRRLALRGSAAASLGFVRARVRYACLVCFLFLSVVSRPPASAVRLGARCSAPSTRDVVVVRRFRLASRFPSRGRALPLLPVRPASCCSYFAFSAFLLFSPSLAPLPLISSPPPPSPPPLLPSPPPFPPPSPPPLITIVAPCRESRLYNRMPKCSCPSVRFGL